ncbi:amyloid protein-binding protein 2-like isoform X3 [Mercenaria mercenaria]|uniref:amyloid protein-binding protein 2-like isoform X3 n=1 Tax=Mercenaria mercenaria TaxID=6596 RepID=UPI00234E7043|nr:amyloid protein-binding protein 2-like isoform X3 [Mercenaria mercenaria]
MTAAVHRKGTFILSDPEPIRESGLDKQNVMRLRINRIALVQELRVEHILGHLVECGVLSEDDLRRINAGSTAADKARVLVDLLPAKGQHIDWYRAFREALQNPDAGQEVRKRYKLLVEFLDNTVIHRPNSQHTKFSEVESPRHKLPRYKPLPSIKSPDGEAQNVLNIEEERKQEEEKVLREIEETEEKYPTWSGRFEKTNDAVTLVKGYFQQWIPTPDNFRSLLTIPEEHFHKLEKSADPADKEQLEQESRALEKIKKLELVTVLSRRKMLPVGFELCMCDTVQDILQEPQFYHLYFKYLKSLESVDVNLLQDIVSSFYSVLKSNNKVARNADSVKQFTTLAFSLIDFMTEYGYYTDAEKVMSILMSFLRESHHLDIWMTKYHGYIKLMHLRNRNYNFMGASQAYQAAVEMTWQIKMMSFGQDILNEAEIYTELSHMLLELGSVNPAFAWSQNALKEVKPSDKIVLINTLCNAVMAYCAKWQIKRAEKLAIYTVQLAKHHFGQRNPLYLKALLHLCHFATEFRQDESCLQLAMFSLSTAKKIYCCDTIELAFAHRAVSKALMVLQKFDTEKYFYHSFEALRIAKKILTEDHPMLYLFLHTSASALQWKAFHANKETQDATLRMAEAEARKALELVIQHYGEVSLRTAQVYALLGQVYSKMDRLQLAEDMMQTSVALMKLCQSSNSYFRLLAAATLGTFYKITEKPKECIMILKNVVDNVASTEHIRESSGVYMKWIHTCFENLIHTLQSLNMNKQVDSAQIQLSHWLRENPKLDSTVTIATLHEEPQGFEQFMTDFNIWDKKMKKALNFAKELKETEDIVEKAFKL